MALPVLSVQSGGMVLGKVGDAEIAWCVEHASSFYTVSFDPPLASQPDEYHTLRIEAVRSDVTTYSNTGYYDEPVFYDPPFGPVTRVSVSELVQMLKAMSGEGSRQVVAKLSSVQLPSSGTIGRFDLFGSYTGTGYKGQ